MLDKAARKTEQKKNYDELFKAKWIEQKGRCAYCGRAIPQLDRQHRKARGMGGGYREDSAGNVTLICRECHRANPYELSKFTGERRQ